MRGIKKDKLKKEPKESNKKHFDREKQNPVSFNIDVKKEKQIRKTTNEMIDR